MDKKMKEKTFSPPPFGAEDAIRWYLVGGRRSGRTAMAAKVYIMHAFGNIGMWVDVVDHHPTHQAKTNLMHTIKIMAPSIIGDMSVYYKIEYKQHGLRIIPVENEND